MGLDKRAKFFHTDTVMRILLKTASFFIMVCLLNSTVMAQIIPTVQSSIQTENAPVPSISLTKPLFFPGEAITLHYDGQPQHLEVSLTNTKGESIPYQAVIRQRDGTMLDIEIPFETLPGKYHLVIKAKGQVVIDQALSIGTVLINRNSAIYKPGEVVTSQILSFDNDGRFFCQGNPPIRVRNTVTLEEEQHAAVVHEECTSSKPNFYESVFQTKNIGDYIFTVVSDESTSSAEIISDSFQVKETPQLEVKREAPLFMTKSSENEVKFTIVANEDFEGIVEEIIPSAFELLPGSETMKTPDGIIENESTLRLRFPFVGDTYPVSLEFGETPDEPHLLASYHKFGVINHDGIDFEIPPSVPVVAIDEGRIIEAPQNIADYGITVVVQHAWGRSFYGHLSETQSQPGQEIVKGALLGLSGNTGLSTGPHLHFGMDLDELDSENGYLGKIDPAPYLATKHKYAQSKKQLTWVLSLKKGETATIGYRFKNPSDRSFFSGFGPLKIFDISKSVIYEERTPWFSVNQ